MDVDLAELRDPISCVYAYMMIYFRAFSSVKIIVSTDDP